jgi:hypothetical protein
MPHTQTTQKFNNTPKRVHMYPQNNTIKKIYISINPTPTIYSTKIKKETQTKFKTPSYTFYNKKTLLKCGDIESNPGPRNTLLLNHPQIHQDRQKTYFYNKTTQIKPEYNHIFELYKPYLNHTQTTHTNQHLTQFCINHNHYPKNYLFYAILITLAPTPTQSNNLIAENSIQWTKNLIKNLTESPSPLPTNTHQLQSFHSENPHITKPLESIHEDLYLFISTERPNLAELQHKFPYLPEKMALEALKCLQPIPNFKHPNPTQNYLPINPQNTPHTIPTTQILLWNFGTFNTALPGLQSLTNKLNPPSIIAIQETKLTASKSTKYLQRLFPHYKMIFNNTTTITQTHRTHGQPYNNPRGGLLTIIHQQYAFPGNITKIPTTANISPYLQIIKITNQPFPTYFLIHLYMPTHIDDIILIPIIQTTIFNHVHDNILSNIILLGDFNRDIALIGKQHGTTKTAPTQQGGNNNTSTSLIDGFYTKIQQNSSHIPTCTSKTILNLKQNSDHYPICLNIPPNNIIAKKYTPTPNNRPNILNPIPPKNINMFCIKFS